LANRLFDILECSKVILHVEFFLEAIWTGINMDSPDASAGAMDAPHGAKECGDYSSTVLGKRPAGNEAAASSFNDTVSVERPFYVICDFLATWRARERAFLKLTFRPTGFPALYRFFRG